MASRIPDDLSRNHIVQAMVDFQAGKPHNFSDSTGYDLLHEGLRYPPKAIVGLASEIVLGDPLGPDDFVGGLGSKCFQVLEKLGFEIVPKEESWRQAILRALLRLSGGSMIGRVSRQQIIDKELDNIRASVSSAGKTPEQTLSRELQELRDEGLLQFDGEGEYQFDRDAVSKELRTSSGRGGGPWSKEELEASVVAYLEMFELYRAESAFKKSAYYQELSARYSRSAKAFEYRMQNISRVFELLGRQWLPGLVPAKNVGHKNVEIIEKLISKHEGSAFTGSASLEAKVLDGRNSKRRSRVPPKGNRNPKSKTGESQVIKRDSQVILWVLEEAKGVCESCKNPAPFISSGGRPFLEVHHVHRLADGGPDIIENAVALCPNCHRALHFSSDGELRKQKLLQEVDRLR